MNVWTDTRDAKLRDLAKRGLSASAIAAALGATRNAVAGRCHRKGIALGGRDAAAHDAMRLAVLHMWQDGWTAPEIAAAMHISVGRVTWIIRAARDAGDPRAAPREDPRQRRRPRRAGSPPEMRIVGTPSVTAPEDSETKVRFMAVGRLQCRAILDESVPILVRMCCGAPVKPGSSWCPMHHARHFQPRPERTVRRAREQTAKGRDAA